MSETWEKTFCPSCNSKNFVCLGDLSDQTRMTPQAVNCWSCGKRYWLDECFMEDYIEYLDEEDPVMKPNGEPGPWTTDEILEHLAYAEDGKPTAT